MDRNSHVRSRLIKLFRFASANRRGSTTLAHRHIYILPTRYGLFFGVLLLSLLLGSVNYANNLGFMTTFLLAGLGLIALLHTYRNQIGLEVAAAGAEPVFAGERACFEVRLRNDRRSPRPGIRVRLSKGAVVAMDLPPGEAETARLYQIAPTRGRLPGERVIVSTNYPLGLFQAWSYVELGQEVLVYPAPAATAQAGEAPDWTRCEKGDRGQGADDFAGLKPYRPGDSPRHIDWKVLAREAGLVTRQFGGNRSEQIWLDWASLPNLATEARLSLLCRLVLDVSKRQLTYGLRLPGQVIPPGQGVAHRQHCLAALALFETSR